MTFRSVSRFLPISAILVFIGSALYSLGIEVMLTWGVRAYNPGLFSNGTVLCEPDGTSFTADGFNDRYEMRLFNVGDGSFNEETGFSSMQSLQVTNAVHKAGWTNPFAVEGSLKLPCTYVGDWGDHGDFSAYWRENEDDILDRREEELGRELSDREIDALKLQLAQEASAYYDPLWKALHFVTVVRDKDTGATYRISETPGGSDFLSLGAFAGDIKVWADGTDTSPLRNQWHMTINTDSKKAYLGAPLPARCVWMADLGLTTNDLAGVSERRIALATAFGMKPDRVADVKLELGEIDLTNGRVAYSLDAVAPDGTTNAVTALRYGAELRLLSGTELGRWTETNVVDVANGRTVQVPTQVPTDGNAGFYRLELVLGP